MNWKIALKICGPSAIAAWAFKWLLTDYMEISTIFKTDIYLNIFVISIVFLFCSFMGWLWIKRDYSQNDCRNHIENNEISDNTIEGSMMIGDAAKSIRNNQIKNNKVTGDINLK